ncbi:DUF308 domain-containing protein [Streptomyces sp. DSM 3412]|uniref:DUF308 domain-containing protein n=1 Tax=Streptomyces gottesmaniae TaxID=3075518 RepID=A0ABU2Z8K1_9ACTN|nr:DUF308 domain-containing protein [Streptomyces sp. DSM 3412]MDT0571757.1 DUF308 domain-containing protein [Streptomyces sp. DSM 3412]
MLRTIGLRALAALSFAALALMWPDITSSALALLFGMFALADSMSLLVTAGGVTGRRGLSVACVGGVAGSAVGLVSVAWPGITVGALARLIGAWAVLAAVAQLLGRLSGRSHGLSHSNVLSFATAAWLAAAITVVPAAGTLSATALARITGIAALIAAIALLPALRSALAYPPRSARRPAGPRHCPG